MSETASVSSSSLYDRFMPPSWLQVGVVTAVLFLSGLAAIMLDGVWDTFIQERLWSRVLVAPLIIIYIMVATRILEPFEARALASLQELSTLDDKTYTQLYQDVQRQSRKGMSVALLLGFAFGFISNGPWQVDGDVSWLSWYLALTYGAMFALLAMAIQQAFVGSRLSNRLQQEPLEFDIFYTKQFLPIGMQSLIVALAFVGGSTLVLFLTAMGRNKFGLADLIVHGILILITLLIFFMPLRQTHHILFQAKLTEQDNLRRQLASAYRRLEAMTPDEKQNILPLSTEVNLLRSYEERLQAVPTWPYNAGMLRTLFISVFLPILVTLGQRVANVVAIQLGLGG